MKTTDIDQRIGMPDVDREWARFEREVIDGQRYRTWTPSRVAAAIILAVSLTSVAAAMWYNSSESSEYSENSACSESSEMTKDTRDTPDAFIFDNVEMQEIAATLGRYYHVEPVFGSEEAKHVRLYLQIEKGKSITDVVLLLRSFQKISVTLQDDQLIIN